MADDTLVLARAVETPDELRSHLAEALMPLKESHINISRLTLESIYDINLTVDLFINITKPLISHAKAGILGRILSVACALNKIWDPLNLSTLDLVTVAEWLKSDDGQKILSSVTARAKFEEESATIRTPKLLAWLKIFATAQSDYANERKKTIQRHQKKIDALKMELAYLDVEERYDMCQLADTYYASSHYKQLDQTELEEGCWEALKIDYAAKNLAMPAKTDQILATAVDTSGTTIRAIHITKYCAQDDVRQNLLDYGNGKILWFSAKNDQSGMSRFRNLIAVATGREAPPLAPAPLRVEPAPPVPEVNVSPPLKRRRHAPTIDPIGSGDKSKSSLNAAQQGNSSRIEKLANYSTGKK